MAARFVRRWRFAAVYVTFVVAMSWAVWANDQANAQRVAVIDKALITCRGGTPWVPAPPHPFYD